MTELAGVTADLVVEGEGVEDETGTFRGRVLAIALSEPSSGDRVRRPEASRTWLLVADDERRSPVWVAQDSVTTQRLGR
jgi:hypothetical protein